MTHENELGKWEPVSDAAFTAKPVERWGLAGGGFTILALTLVPERRIKKGKRRKSELCRPDLGQIRQAGDVSCERGPGMFQGAAQNARPLHPLRCLPEDQKTKRGVVHVREIF